MLVPGVLFHHHSSVMDMIDTEETKGETGNRGRRIGRKQNTRRHGKKGERKVWKKGSKKKITNRYTDRYLINENTCSSALFGAGTVLHLDWYNCSYS